VVYRHESKTKPDAVISHLMITKVSLNE